KVMSSYQAVIKDGILRVPRGIILLDQDKILQTERLGPRRFKVKFQHGGSWSMRNLLGGIRPIDFEQKFHWNNEIIWVVVEFTESGWSAPELISELHKGGGGQIGRIMRLIAE
ncbi:MAG: hypothetical protein KC618_07360, partial [Candidatus Omnitrophica bacterium]|nr:hypothetical protein [Candidatus Omnitrophota bacterium]